MKRRQHLCSALLLRLHSHTSAQLHYSLLATAAINSCIYDYTVQRGETVLVDLLEYLP